MNRLPSDRQHCDDQSRHDPSHEWCGVWLDSVGESLEPGTGRVVGHWCGDDARDEDEREKLTREHRYDVPFCCANGFSDADFAGLLLDRVLGESDEFETRHESYEEAYTDPDGKTEDVDQRIAGMTGRALKAMVS